ncbi:MAG: hypothetical protein AB9873_15055 [Syntrophobacteraceae bacterium]
MGFPALPCTVAAIDIGSHTLRLIIARLDGDRVLTPVRLERRITRLAHHFNLDGRLSTTGIDASMRAMGEYAALASQYGVREIACGATGVVRRASDGGAFLERVTRTFGFPAVILSEEDEALFSARGVLSVLPRKRRPILTFDLGGSTTEFLLVDDGRESATWSTSVFVGAATLTESWIRGDPPEAASIIRAADAARDAVRPAIDKVRSLLGPGEAWEDLQLVGTAGTVTTLAAIALGMTRYEAYRVNGLVLQEDWLRKTIGHLGAASLEERRRMPGLEPGREDILLGGAVIVGEILRGLARKELTVTDGGLLEGLLIDVVEKTQGWPQGLQTSLTWGLEGY